MTALHLTSQVDCNKVLVPLATETDERDLQNPVTKSDHEQLGDILHESDDLGESALWAAIKDKRQFQQGSVNSYANVILRGFPVLSHVCEF